MALLDIIVTHSDEPWEVGKPFFDMIEHQRCAGRDGYTVTLVQDGKENALPWHELLADYSYKIKLITIEKSGTATARNVGFKATESHWVMFCNFEDMFNDLCSLSMIMSNLPVECYDLIWAKYVAEEKWNGGGKFINTVKEPILTTTDSKLYRRKFLEEHNITFNTRVPFHYEYMFNSLVIEETTPFRIVTSC